MQEHQIEIGLTQPPRRQGFNPPAVRRMFWEYRNFGGPVVKENSVDVWDAFLNTLENRGVSSSWEVAPEVEEELISLDELLETDIEGKAD